MFGMGWGEIALILVVGIIVFGPDRLPDVARQAAEFVRTARKMVDKAKSDFKDEMGDEFKDVNLRTLDPRLAIRDAWNNPNGPAPARAAAPTLPAVSSFDPSRAAPHDPEAT